MKKQQMFKPTLALFLVAGTVCAFAPRSAAVVQTSSEVWVGSSTTIHGNGGSGSKVNLFSQRMVTPVETAGTVSALPNASLTDTNGTWINGQYGTNGVPAYVEFDNGWMADIADCSASNHCLRLAGGLGAAVSVGNAYRVHKHLTIAAMFGTNNEAGLLSGFNPSTTDNILLEVPQTQQIITVFYYNDGTYQGWLQADYSPAGNVVIYPEQGVMVRRRTSSDVSLYLAGPVKTGVTIATVDQGNNLLGTLKSATPLTLAGLNLYTGDPTTGIASGWNPTTSDNLLVIQPNGSPLTYFYYKDPTFEGWLDASYNLANTAQINPGAAFFIRRKAPNSSFNWTIPAE
jgi:hypothetical protein